MGNRQVAAPVEIPAALATRDLRMTREQIVRRIQKGVLRGRFDASAGWVVDTDSIAEFKRRVAEPMARAS